MDGERYTAVGIIRGYERRPVKLLTSSTYTPASAFPLCGIQNWGTVKKGRNL